GGIPGRSAAAMAARHDNATAVFRLQFGDAVDEEDGPASLHGNDGPRHAQAARLRRAGLALATSPETPSRAPADSSMIWNRSRSTLPGIVRPRSAAWQKPKGS